MFDFIESLLKDFGLERGLFVVFFFGAHWYIYRLYQGRLEDRQKEIDRLIQDNKDYKDRLLALMDERFSRKE